MNLQKVLVIKREVVHPKDHSDEVADSFSGKQFVWTSVEKMAQASIPSLCGMLVYNEETSSMTRIALLGKGPSSWSLGRKWVVPLPVGWKCLY